MISMEYVTSAELQEETQALAYADWGYYERWGVALAKVLLRKGLLDVPDLGRALGVYNTTECQGQGFALTEVRGADDDVPKGSKSDYMIIIIRQGVDKVPIKTFHQFSNTFMPLHADRP